MLPVHRFTSPEVVHSQLSCLCTWHLRKVYVEEPRSGSVLFQIDSVAPPLSSLVSWFAKNSSTSSWECRMIWSKTLTAATKKATLLLTCQSKTNLSEPALALENPRGPPFSTTVANLTSLNLTRSRPTGPVSVASPRKPPEKSRIENRMLQRLDFRQEAASRCARKCWRWPICLSCHRTNTHWNTHSQFTIQVWKGLNFRSLVILK